MIKFNILKRLFKRAPMNFYNYVDGTTVIKSINNTFQGYKFDKIIDEEHISSIWSSIKQYKRITTIGVFLAFIILLYGVIFPYYTFLSKLRWYFSALPLLIAIFVIYQTILRICTAHFEKWLKKNFGEFERTVYNPTDFIDEKYYYIIVLEHFDVRDIKKEIIIKYTSLENSTITKKLRKNVELKSSKPKIIMPIIQEEKQEKEDIVEIKPIEYGLEMLENVEDYTIIGEPVETILPFTVTEDGIESNLMVKASSSAYWCRVKVIQEYNENNEIERKLIFRITNKPLIIRKTKIMVSIIDLPYINISFILTNKPS